MNDRFVRPDGSLQLDAPNFDRALNFRSDTYDLGFNVVFRSDNGRLLSERAFIAPYFTLGAGLMLYDLRTDMRDDAGNPYDFSDPNLVQNRVFETRLADFQTEQVPNDGYAFYLNAGLGVRFRLNARFELFAQTDIMRAFSDQLDGVGGTFRESYASEFEAFLASPGTGGAGIEPGARRGDPDLRQDWVLFHGIGLKYSFGAQRNDFRAPKLSTPRPSYLEARGDIERARDEAERAQARREREKAAADSLERAQLLEQMASARGQQERVVNHFYIETPDYAQLDRMDEQMQRLMWQQEIDRRERQKLANKQEATQNSALLTTFGTQREQLRRDTLLVAQERDSSLKATEDRVLELRYAQYRLEQEELRLDAEIDSLRALAAGPVTPVMGRSSLTRAETAAVDRRALAKEMEAICCVRVLDGIRRPRAA
ncbi:OmpA/MotB domain-containing protein [Nitritalea halalkaliphila LW7]|uniref:OmpA/MotB domain-containing protein n=1 Tax=Nitritalea halalkaliphila LW7 TaxID=1189621 RepID=I5C9F3_9BACT|nr:hypothetical protein [Nitritalea halalkaliphila]EIM78455.1 OmpA/MotB domain-containing protein [Nitritalea halalkaliphila LW7]